MLVLLEPGWLEPLGQKVGIPIHRISRGLTKESPSYPFEKTFLKDSYPCFKAFLRKRIGKIRVVFGVELAVVLQDKNH